MKVVSVGIKKIKPYERNPRKNEKAIAGVAASIAEFGFQQPIVLDKDGVIIAGHTRFMAAKKLGMAEVPCVYAVDLTPEQVRAYRLADNKVAEASKWDDALLADELNAILDIDMSAFGFDLKYTPVDGGDDYDPTPPKEPKTKPGDLYKLGAHFLLCGDCTKNADVDRLMQGKKAALLLTDPPYNVAYSGGTGLTIDNDNMSDEKYFNFLRDSFAPAARVLDAGGAFYIWHADSNGYTTRGAVLAAGLRVRQVLVWVKNAMVLGRQDFQWQHEPCLFGEALPGDDKDYDPALYGWNEGGPHLWRGGRKQKTVLEFDRPARSAEHPTMKPLALWSYLIENSTLPGALIYDPFCGSGTTVIAAERLGRVARVMEIDPGYCDVIVARWEAETGGSAVLL